MMDYSNKTSYTEMLQVTIKEARRLCSLVQVKKENSSFRQVSRVILQTTVVGTRGIPRELISFLI